MREKLLVADDEPDIVTMLKNYFELNGYDVLTAANGLEAVAQAEKAARFDSAGHQHARP